MIIDTNTMISITEANQNFSKVTKLVDEKGTAIILKNNVPRYLVIDFSKAEESAVAADEDVLAISKRLLKKNKEAYKLAMQLLLKRLQTILHRAVVVNNI